MGLTGTKSCYKGRVGYLLVLLIFVTFFVTFFLARRRAEKKRLKAQDDFHSAYSGTHWKFKDYEK